MDNLDEIGFPLLRWAGSKKRSARVLISYFPADISRYVELFAGSACLFFYTNADSHLISDSNVNVMNFYQDISIYFDKMYSDLMTLPRTRETYYRVRDEFNMGGHGVGRSVQFWYLNRNCFNGIYRENRDGKFNVPFSESRVAPYPRYDQVCASASKLSTAITATGDFEVVGKENIKKGDFVYLDPPFYVPERRIFREYSSSPFNIDDFSRLDNFLSFIDHSGARFLLSYPECDILDNLKRRWSFDIISVRRYISGKTQGRILGQEVLIRNF